MDTTRIGLPTPGTAPRGSPQVPAIVIATFMAAILVAGPVGGARASGEDAFPVTVTDDEGTLVSIESLPERIVSLSPANTEIVFTLGAGDRLMGGTDFDDYPPEAAELPDVVTLTVVSIERVVDLEPDLVLAAGNSFTPVDDIERMRELGIPVVVVYAETVPEVLADIELIGTSIGAAEEAQALTAGMATRLDEVASVVLEVSDRPRTYYELDTFEGVTYGPAPDSFVADMVELAGGAPITTGDPALFEMPLERLLVADPEIIILGDAMFGVCPADVANRPGWSNMTAVREGAIRPVDDVPVTRPGPRLAEGLASLARAIHPEIEVAGAVKEPPFCPAA